MQLDKLQMELRPRSNAQALDLGFALLREHAGDVYRTWLALWLPLMAVCAVGSAFAPTYTWAFTLFAWWLKPLLERAPLYVLSREVFGEPVSPRAALRAWPRQWRGMLTLLTWARPLAAGRGVLVPVWQLEQLRGKPARARMRVLARESTSRAAFWFGVVCAHFEWVLQLGLVALVGTFIDTGGAVNPLALFADAMTGESTLARAVVLGGYALAGGIIGPVYTACTFTLYLNRRAQLEAWDIEIVLRQIARPAVQGARTLAAWLAAALLPLLVGAALMQAVPAFARAADATAPACEGADNFVSKDGVPRAPTADADALAVRRIIDAIETMPDLLRYECRLSWQRKDKTKPKPERDDDRTDWTLLAQVLRVVLIAIALGAVGWVAWRYRERMGGFVRRAVPKATEVAGLDIRASSLPRDVAAAVQALWRSGERRAALALLYRATLARLVDADGLMLHQGATEGDCLRLARQQLRAERFGAVDAVTHVWLAGAYGLRWPDDATVDALCASWQRQFGGPAMEAP